MNFKPGTDAVQAGNKGMPRGAPHARKKGRASRCAACQKKKGAPRGAPHARKKGAPRGAPFDLA